ncbi:MAG: 23S rRNA (adenine(2503)-C(2))-methyltransferase RlmN [Alphaproteobacteria bacterium]|nr:23S rRNA (adenine(2503)-C(2))-methyltransferase RlmN [Alphaproteobacteria bacterium]MCB9929971.1 23S rRNA (adenine(2503)-C(2))-methyltransferase RlmN [Alphaproteobacteria bacterium]
MQAQVTTLAPPSAPAGSRVNLIGLDRQDLAEALAPVGVEGFRVRQIWQWLYHRGATDFEQMTNLSKAVRAVLAEHCAIVRPAVSLHQQSSDGTQKWLLRFPDGKEVESVHIPESDRGTLCVSSQVGCTLNCKFCHTGTQRWVRNLSPAEIVGQVMLARDAFGEWPAPEHDRALTNIVLMGMGEPLYNYDNVAKAMRIVMDGEGLAISKRRITLSTAGVVPLIGRVGEELGLNLAISLHAVRDELRDELVPINRKYPLEQLMQACRDYPGLSNARRITFEYVMLKGVNDSLADARAMVDLLKGIPAKINLIPFNPWPGSVFECSSNNAIRRFADYLSEQNLSAPVRHPRGQDILAACGQLKSASEKLRASERRKAAAAE